ncbi:ABC transporter substrate-binding protein [Janibacter hoylei]|uniref:ABC transporter substrate-binding protein n=1 Tax=Janibacter hoylei TaxID=364298 RepID=UPI0027BAEE51|nr:ABC transporter substrate-binding protein [Janibacter hoylei]
MSTHTSRRSVLLGLAGIATTSALAGCTLPTSDAAGTGPGGRVTFRYQGSANNVTFPELADDLGYFPTIDLEYVGATVSGPQDIQSVATGQTDVGGAFSGAIVKLAQAGSPITAVINYYGSDKKSYQGLYVRKDSGIRRPKDLVGKKIAVNTLGAHAEAFIETWLTTAGLTSREIDQVQLVVLPPNDTEEAIRRRQIDVGALGGVLQDRALSQPDIRELVRDTEVLGHELNGGQYVLRDDFIDQHPDAVREFTTGVAKAIEWARRTPRATVHARFERIIEGRDRNESTDNVRFWKSTGVPAKGGAVSDEDFTQWAAWLESTGIVDQADLDPASIYTNEYNDLAKEGTK